MVRARAECFYLRTETSVNPLWQKLSETVEHVEAVDESEVGIIELFMPKCNMTALGFVGKQLVGMYTSTVLLRLSPDSCFAVEFLMASRA